MKTPALLVLMLAVPGLALASSGGAPGYSGKSGATCSGCHSGGSTVPTVTLTGPASLSAGASGTYTLTISGGPGVKAGMTIAADKGTLAAVSSTVYAYQNEILQKQPIAFSSGQVQVQFSVTAPSTTGTLKLFAAGNSVNGTGGTGGDRDAATTKTVTITAGNAAPTVATAANANPTTVTGTTTSLSVLGADDGGEANLTYTWAATGPASVTFSANGTNAAKSATATFSRAGSYTFTCTIRDAAGAQVTSSKAVTVNASVSTIAVSAPSTQVVVGSTLQLSAMATDQFGNAVSPTFTWTTSGGGTINASGLFTAGNTAGGPFTITAAAGGKSGTKQVSVVSANAPSIATAPASNPSPVTGKTATLTVLGADDGGEANLIYTWSSTSGPAAVAFSVNGSNAAKSTVATFTKAGAYVLSVQLKDQTNLTTTATLNLTVNATLNSIAVTPASITVPLSGTQDFNAQAKDQFGAVLATQPAFTWTVSGGGSINSTGIFTAGSASGGPYTVTATAGAKSGTANVSIAAGNAPTVAMAASSSQSPVMGTTVDLSVLGADDQGEANLVYAWTSIAGPTAVTFSANDTNAAKNTTATFARAGSYTLQATIKDGNGLSVTSSVNVAVDQTFTRLTVSPATATLAPNAQQQFTASAEDQFARPMNPQPTVAWNLVGGGSVNSSGVYTAPSTIGGPFSVIATSGGQTATAQVSVASTAPPTIAQPASADPSTVVSKSTTLRVMGSDTSGETNLRYKWESMSGPAPIVFSVNDSNVAKTTTARFSKAGTYLVQVSVTNPANLTSTSEVTVTVDQSLSGVRVDPATITVLPGATQQFNANGADQFGDMMPLGSTPTWTLNGGGELTADGLFTAQSTPGGPFVVTAAAGSRSGTGVVLVSDSNDRDPPVLDLVGIEKDQAIHEAVELSANVQDASAIASVSFLIDDQIAATLISEPWSYVLDSKTLGDGPHRISVMARDVAGNAARTANLGFFADNTTPTVRWISPSTGEPVSNTLRGQLDVGDNLGVSSVTIMVDDRELAVVTGSPWSFEADLSEIPNGSHFVDAIAKDRAGNEMTARLKIEVENKLPEAVGGVGCAASGANPALLAVVLAALALVLRRTGRGSTER